MTSQRSRELDALEDSYKLRIKQLADNKDREASVSHVLLSLSLARQTSVGVFQYEHVDGHILSSQSLAPKNTYTCMNKEPTN